MYKTYFNRREVLIQIVICVGIVICYIAAVISEKKEKKPPPPMPILETWTAVIQQFDTITHQEVVFYGYVTDKDFKTCSVTLMHNSIITTNDFLAINDAVDPWDEDITLKSGLHVKIERLYLGKSKSTTKMDSLRNIKEHGQPINFN